MPIEQGTPLRGEIWFVRIPVYPRDKGLPPVLIVSTNERNRHPRANTVLVAPLSTSIHRQAPTHMLLTPGETGLNEASVIKAEDLQTVRKESLQRPRTKLRQLSNARVC